jgi:hypothetical protein
VVKKEKPFQDTFAETLCYTMMLGEVVLPLVASMYVLGRVESKETHSIPSWREHAIISRPEGKANKGMMDI